MSRLVFDNDVWMSTTPAVTPRSSFRSVDDRREREAARKAAAEAAEKRFKKLRKIKDFCVKRTLLIVVTVLSFAAAAFLVLLGLNRQQNTLAPTNMFGDQDHESANYPSVSEQLPLVAANSGVHQQQVVQVSPTNNNPAAVNQHFSAILSSVQAQVPQNAVNGGAHVGQQQVLQHVQPVVPQTVPQPAVPVQHVPQQVAQQIQPVQQQLPVQQVIVQPVPHVPQPVQHVPQPVQHVPQPVQHVPQPVQHVPQLVPQIIVTQPPPPPSPIPTPAYREPAIPPSVLPSGVSNSIVAPVVAQGTLSSAPVATNGASVAPAVQQQVLGSASSDTPTITNIVGPPTPVSTPSLVYQALNPNPVAPVGIQLPRDDGLIVDPAVISGGAVAVPQPKPDSRQESAELVELSACPEADGLQLYPHPKYCDQFYKCANGTLTLEFCENGLLFDGKGNVYNYCNYHWSVDCGKRVSEIAEIRSSGCPYRFGIFPIETQNCATSYYKCAFGIPETQPCQPGLAYDDRIHQCNWPDLTPNCDPETIVGFRCPDKLPPGSLAVRFMPFPRFDAGRCDALIVCVNGYPRLIRCTDDKVFNRDILTCDYPENVPKCANYHASREKEQYNNR